MKCLKLTTQYVLAKQDKRYKYDFCPVFHRSTVFYDLNKIKKVRDKKQKLYKAKLVILRRTCKTLKI